MNLSVTAAAPVPSAPGSASASAAGTGSGSAFQTLLDALAVLPHRRQVPGPPAAELLAAEPGSGTEPVPGLDTPGLSAAALPGIGSGTAPEVFGFSPAAGTPAAAAAIDTESSAAPVAEDTAPALPAAAAPVPGAHGPALPPAVLPALVPVSLTPAHARLPAASGTPGAAGSTAASTLPGDAPVAGSHAGAEAAPSFRFPGLQGTGMAQRPAALQVSFPASSGDSGFVPEVPGTPAAPVAGMPAVPPAAQPAAAVPAAAPGAPQSAAGQPQLHTQLARPVFSLLAAGSGEHVMTLKVTPESLGTVTVRAVIGTDGVRLELFAADAGRDAVRAALPELRRELAGSGFNATLDLGTGSRSDGQDRGQEHQRRPGSHDAPEIPVPAARPQDPAPSHRIPDGASALDLLA